MNEQRIENKDRPSESVGFMEAGGAGLQLSSEDEGGGWRNPPSIAVCQRDKKVNLKD